MRHTQQHTAPLTCNAPGAQQQLREGAAAAHCQRRQHHDVHTGASCQPKVKPALCFVCDLGVVCAEGGRRQHYNKVQFGTSGKR